jgi:hypothetical protein
MSERQEQPQERDWRCHPDCCPDGSPRCADDPYEAASQEREDAPARALRRFDCVEGPTGPGNHGWGPPTMEEFSEGDWVRHEDAAQLEQALERATEEIEKCPPDRAYIGRIAEWLRGGAKMPPPWASHDEHAAARQQLEGGTGADG